jgi:thiol-disulfide isomerase/thioredoxin
MAALASAMAFGSAALSQNGADVDRRWLDTTTTSAERERMTAMIGHAPPEFPASVRFVGDALSLDELRGKVVIVQFWSRSDRRSTLRLEQLAALGARSGEDLAIVAIHTQNQGEGVEQFLERRQVGVPVAIDADGAFAEALGVNSSLANLVIDRVGNARFALLNPTGLESAAELLLSEAPPPPESTPGAGSPERAPPTAKLPAKKRDRSGFWAERIDDERFPAFDARVGNANDLRATKGPPIVVEEWLTPAPDARDKVVIVDFWATWCGPCIAAIPHMNALQQAFPGEALVIGISNEPVEKVRGWLPGKGIQYTIGVDTRQRMGGVVQNRTIPYAIVYSPDGVIRWQGHPNLLTEEDLRAIVEASRGG